VSRYSWFFDDAVSGRGARAQDLEHHNRIGDDRRAAWDGRTHHKRVRVTDAARHGDLQLTAVNLARLGAKAVRQSNDQVALDR
jgi:hypothetical protein